MCVCVCVCVCDYGFLYASEPFENHMSANVSIVIYRCIQVI